MRQKLSDLIGRYNYMDWGVLYLRMMLGVSMMLHNIGKMQNYNEIIDSYPSLLHLGGAVTFVVIAVVEVVLSVALMLGLWVRFAAAIMTLGMVWIAFSLGFPSGESALIFAAVYVFLVIGGGGIYSFDAVSSPYADKKGYK
ncbi:MAG: DoxX family protein [Alistipes sp.]